MVAVHPIVHIPVRRSSWAGRVRYVFNATNVSYEEYHPYGTTAWWTDPGSTVSQKRYRYTGKEKDEESGLYYHGARYYAPWISRWTACDPVPTEPRYAYCRNNPLRYRDPTGRAPPPDDTDTSPEAESEGYIITHQTPDTVGRTLARLGDPTGAGRYAAHYGEAVGQQSDIVVALNRWADDRFGLTDEASSKFWSFTTSDWLGRRIAGHYFAGWSTPMGIGPDPMVSSYMAEDATFAAGLVRSMDNFVGRAYLQLAQQGYPLAAQGYAGEQANPIVASFEGAFIFHGQAKIGQRITGANQMGGSNARVGDTLVTGQFLIEEVEPGKLVYSFTGHVVFKDLTDPAAYKTDSTRNWIAEILTGGSAAPYVLHVTWEQTILRRGLAEGGLAVDDMLLPDDLEERKQYLDAMHLEDVKKSPQPDWAWQP